MERCPSKIVIDASVVAKWFVPEWDTDAALRVRDSFARGDIILAAPDLLIYEVCNTLRYRADLSEDGILEYISILYQLEIELSAPGPKDMLRAVAEAAHRDLSVYDGSYVALAKRESTKVLTADAKLHSSGGGHDTLLLQDLGVTWDLP